MVRLLKDYRLATNITRLRVELIELKRLETHEEVDLSHLKELKKEIESDKILKYAIAVDKNTNVILDGNHRFSVLLQLRRKKIPVVFLDYNSPQIEVQSWRGNWKVTKERVIEAGFSQRKLPPKTSKHMIRISGKLKHISIIEKKVGFPLWALENLT